jgi:hypothetical protein
MSGDIKLTVEEVVLSRDQPGKKLEENHVVYVVEVTSDTGVWREELTKPEDVRLLIKGARMVHAVLRKGLLDIYPDKW